jgi:hypothetical protein
MEQTSAASFAMHTDRTLTFALAAACLLLSACGDRHFDQGPMRTESRDVGTFTAIDMDGDGRLQIDVGSPASVTVEGKQSVVTALKTEVRGDTLYISSKRKDWMFFGGSQRLTLRITVPRLASLALDGGNDVRLSGFNGGESNIKVQGAAHVQADGTLKELTIYMAGAGHADFSKLVANDAKVTVDGVGSVFVNSRNSLNATMNGVGAILYTGNPHVVNTSMNGLGRISQRNPKDLERRDKDEGERPDERGSVDPESLQPEYEKDTNKGGRKGSDKDPPGGVTEVI